MRLRSFRCSPVLAGVLLSGLLSTHSAWGEPISLPVHHDSLENGLKILVVPDTNVAVVSCRLYYFVGSMYEGPGTSGLSHMYEHMMFKGTKTLGTTNYKKEVPIMRTIDSLGTIMTDLRTDQDPSNDARADSLRAQIAQLLEKQRTYIKKDEIWQLYLNNGGTHLNAWTSDDMTAYIVTLPTNKVELFYWIESDRMKNPVLREFYSERDVVMEERRMRYENRPIGTYWERLWALFYTAHPYRIPTIGWMSDIEAYTRSKLMDHVNQYYTPDNALIVLSGNIDPERAVKQIRRYFGSIPKASRPKQEVVTREPSPAGETRFVMRDEAEPRIDLLFHIPGYPHADLYKLDVIEGILSGRSGRLYDRLVNKENLCTNAGASNYFQLHNGLFHVWAMPRTDVDPAEVERIILEELGKLSNKPPSDHEMQRNKNSIRMNFVNGLRSLEGISDRLAWFERLGNWEDMFAYPDQINSVQAESIPEIAARYFTVDRRTTGMLLPPNQNDSQAPESDQSKTTGN